VSTSVHVGLSGWAYRGWRGTYYPRGLPQRLELEHAAARVGSIELNGTFYSLQRPSSYRSWAARVPDGVLLPVKGPRLVTHLKRLRDVEQPLARFLSSGPLLLGDRLGPFLWQLPARTTFDPSVLEPFLRDLPRTEGEAARLARTADDLVRDRFDEAPWRRAGPGRADRPLRHALEVRHESFRDDAFVDLCRALDVAVVVSDGAGRWPELDAVTSDHVYVRLHGSQELYTSGYSPAELDTWAERVRGWAATPGVRLVTVHFDNDAKVHAPADAESLSQRLGLERGRGVVE
jgi:uncharacterized protein YecE (DUF72 family)